MNIVPSGGYAFGPFVLNLQRMSLQRDGHDIDLRPKAFDVLRHLIGRSGSVVTKEELLAAAWPNVFVADDALTQCIRDIRKALGDDGEEYIRTVPRRGYLFTAHVTALDAVGARKRRRRSVAAALTLLAVALVVIAAVAGLRSLRLVEAAPPVVASANPSLAVLPFEDMTGNPDLAYFGAGVSGDIIAMLARVPELTVIARNSSFKYRGQAVDVRRIGEELGATHVLEGSVRKDADRLRIVAQLIDARTGKHVWAERFDRTDTDPRALQDEVTEKIVAALVGTAGTITLQQYREAWGKDSANLEEYDYVLRALARFAIGTPEAMELSEAVLAEGLTKFPSSRLLKAQSAGAIIWRFARGWSDSENPLEDIRKAGRLAREALGDPKGSPMSRVGLHVVLAYVNMAERKFGQAVAEAETALALSPYDGRLVYFLVEIPIVAGRPDLALEWIERAMALYHADDPRQQELKSMKASALLHASGPEAALEVLDTIRTNDAIVLRTTYLLRSYALVALDRLDEAKREVEKLQEHDPTWTQSRHRKRFFYVDPKFLERSVDAMILAGLPED